MPENKFNPMSRDGVHQVFLVVFLKQCGAVNQPAEGLLQKSQQAELGPEYQTLRDDLQAKVGIEIRDFPSQLKRIINKIIKRVQAKMPDVCGVGIIIGI